MQLSASPNRQYAKIPKQSDFLAVSTLFVKTNAYFRFNQLAAILSPKKGKWFEGRLLFIPNSRNGLSIYFSLDAGKTPFHPKNQIKK
ncbi:hypothetical protein P872_04210 [Rhodonellum psychrophilum GCM71 = DSM 17998]|uniref:Uncharacterized protein n=1 Tax=Rhodonellum psychrophilum GCM71 = DSM 17998 TaxID=1123057 RepID=U5BXY6_9BACT|nr:hypothetical protein P872_04210 [Rhodonellum psychrophilum GCM71 = DSM 17998]